MHVNGLNRNQGAQPRGVLNDDLGDEPGIEYPVVCVNQDPFAAIRLTPFRDIDDSLEILAGRVIARLRAGRKNPYLPLRVHLALHVIRFYKLAALQSMYRRCWVAHTTSRMDSFAGPRLNNSTQRSPVPLT